MRPLFPLGLPSIPDGRGTGTFCRVVSNKAASELGLSCDTFDP
jgi:hypothetical protein